LETDALIQKTIDKEFSDCTRLTIAHRLNTVITSDRVLVMDKGLAAEFDTPKNLLMNKNGIFSQLVDQTGQANAKLLRSMVFGEEKVETVKPQESTVEKQEIKNEETKIDSVKPQESTVTNTEEISVETKTEETKDDNVKSQESTVDKQETKTEEMKVDNVKPQESTVTKTEEIIVENKPEEIVEESKNVE
jgi:ABC-type multidrug transport system ATPase subunit